MNNAICGIAYIEERKTPAVVVLCFIAALESDLSKNKIYRFVYIKFLVLVLFLSSHILLIHTESFGAQFYVELFPGPPP